MKMAMNLAWMMELLMDLLKAQLMEYHWVSMWVSIDGMLSRHGGVGIVDAVRQSGNSTS